MPPSLGELILGWEGQVVQACLSSLANKGATAPGVLRPWPLWGYSVLEGEPTWGGVNMNAEAGLR